ncbi:FAD-dependent monooxygenase, partial [bacterium]|nr:FAD-dependent monooxygenase [bacterium]
MPIFTNIKIKPGISIESTALNLDPQMKSFRILKKSVDARKKSNITLVYTIETFETEELPKFEYSHIETFKVDQKIKIGIIGAGPAGMFAALRLIEHGIPCALFERGKRVQDRMKDIARFWRYGELNEDSNVC